MSINESMFTYTGTLHKNLWKQSSLDLWRLTDKLISNNQLTLCFTLSMLCMLKVFSLITSNEG